MARIILVSMVDDEEDDALDYQLDHNPDLNRDITFADRESEYKTRTLSKRVEMRNIRTATWWIDNIAVVHLSTRGVE